MIWMKSARVNPQLPPTISSQFWKYWKEIHVPDVKELRPSLKKYTINRIDHKIVGEDKFWGLVETWWESEDDMRLAFSSLKLLVL